MAISQDSSLSGADTYVMGVLKAARAVTDEYLKVYVMLVALVMDEAHEDPSTWSVDEYMLNKFDRVYGGGPPNLLDISHHTVLLDQHSSCVEFHKQLFSMAYESCEDKLKVAELQEIFGLIDTDGSGSITGDEFYHLLCLVGMKAKHSPQRPLRHTPCASLM